MSIINFKNVSAFGKINTLGIHRFNLKEKDYSCLSLLTLLIISVLLFGMMAKKMSSVEFTLEQAYQLKYFVTVGIDVLTKWLPRSGFYFHSSCYNGHNHSQVIIYYNTYICYQNYHIHKYSVLLIPYNYFVHVC